MIARAPTQVYDADLTHDEVRAYIDSLPPEATTLLTAEQEWALSRRIEAGNAALATIHDTSIDLTTKECIELGKIVEDGKDAANTLTLANLRLVISIAKWYAGQGMGLMDLISEGNIGLMRGVQRFNWRKKCRATTYLSWWIRQAVSRALIEQGHAIYLPHQVVDSAKKVRRVLRELQQELGREPSPEEIASRMGKEVVWVQAHLSLPEVDVYFGEPAGDGNEDGHDESILYRLPAQEPAHNERAISARNEKLLTWLKEHLNEREVSMLIQYYGLFGHPKWILEQVHKEHGVSRERCRQIIHRAVEKLRKVASGNPGLVKALVL